MKICKKHEETKRNAVFYANNTNKDVTQTIPKETTERMDDN